MSEPFIGEIRIWGCNYAPRNWAICNGGYLQISEFSALFAIIGTLYGGDGRTNFRLPDLRGRSPMHWGNGPGLTYRPIAEKAGVATVPLTENEIPMHDHVVHGAVQLGSSPEPSPSYMLGVDPNETEIISFMSKNVSANTTMSNSMFSTTGESQPHENRQPLLSLNFCIALDGIFPPRN
ncbi:phage tail protein [Aliikangiella maris]|uniref:Tail fiber protein n=2 Tax=Aliikangiella maris TaxID=3162458 RepID=A0ABV2BSQ9_9GAMM